MKMVVVNFMFRRWLRNLQGLVIIIECLVGIREGKKSYLLESRYVVLDQTSELAERLSSNSPAPGGLLTTIDYRVLIFSDTSVCGVCAQVFPK